MNAKQFQCPICRKWYTQKAYLKEHSKIHTGHDLHRCEHPGCTVKGFPSKRNLQTHIREKHDKVPYKCLKCQRDFQTLAKLTSHKKRRTHQCEFCCQSYDYPEWLKKHIRKIHPDKQCPDRLGTIQMSTKPRKSQTTQLKSSGPQDCTPAKKPRMRLPTRASIKQGQGRQSTFSATCSTTHGINTQMEHQSGHDEDVGQAGPVNGEKLWPGDHSYEDEHDHEAVAVHADQHFIPRSLVDGIQPPEELEIELSVDNVTNQQEEGVVDVVEYPDDISTSPIENNSCTTTANQTNDYIIEIQLNQGVNKFGSFLLNIWLMTWLKDMNLQESGQKQDVNRAAMMKKLSSFLCCKWDENIDYKIMMQDFSWVLETTSNFVGGILLVDYMRTKNKKCLLDLYKEASDTNFPDNVYELVELFVLFKFQNQVLQEYPQTTLLESLPIPIREKLSFEFCSIFESSKEGGQNGNSNALLTTNEYRLGFEITRVLLEMINRHVSISHGLETVEKTKALTYFNQFALNYMATLHEDTPSAYRTLLWTAQEEKVGTETLLIKLFNNTEVEVNVHSQLLPINKNDGGTFVSPNQATKDDVESFITIVYKRNFVYSNKPTKITVGLCQVLEQVGIVDIWSFLFPNKFDINQFIELDNQMSLLPVLYRLDRKQEIQLVIETVPELLSPLSIQNFICQLSPQHLKSFISNERLLMDGLTKYKVLIRWAYAAAGEDCVDPMDCYRHPKVDEYFITVKNALPLESMSKHYGRLVKLGYIKPDDRQKIRNLATVEATSL